MSAYTSDCHCCIHHLVSIGFVLWVFGSNLCFDCYLSYHYISMLFPHICQFYLGLDKSQPTLRITPHHQEKLSINIRRPRRETFEKLWMLFPTNWKFSLPWKVFSNPGFTTKKRQRAESREFARLKSDYYLLNVDQIYSSLQKIGAQTYYKTF